MIAVSSDVHKRLCKMAILRPGEKLKMLEAIECKREAWLERLSELPPEAEIALEVSTTGYFVMSLLEEAGWGERAHWVHTAGIDSLRKQKSDRLDTRRLAQKLAVSELEPLPEAWFPPVAIRHLRLLARQRCWLTLLRSQTKNRVRSLLEMHGLQEAGNPFSPAGRAWVEKQKLAEPVGECFQQMLRVYDFLEAERESSEASLVAYSKNFPEIARLRSIPGIGHILAAVIWSEIGELSRFAGADALVNYTGLAPSLYASGEVLVQGGITRQGPRWLRWALITAANAVTHSKSALGRRYWRLRRRKPGNVAKTAVAVSLARCIYGVLQHGEDYQEERWGRKAGEEMKQEA